MYDTVRMFTYTAIRVKRSLVHIYLDALQPGIGGVGFSKKVSIDLFIGASKSDSVEEKISSTQDRQTYL